jgi:hypothetical protein
MQRWKKVLSNLWTQQEGDNYAVVFNLITQ